MVQRKFNKLKFKRTYIGGSKSSENKIFKEVQGEKEDNSDCNWIEYRRLFTEYMDDKLNILLSWIYLSNIVSIAFAAITFFLLFININIAFIVFGFSIIFQLILRYLKYKEKQLLFGYDFSLDIILREIKNRTGLQLSKN